MKPIFVYGSLMPNHWNAHLWEEDAIAMPATLDGFRLVSWHRNFPYAIPAEGERTKGYLVVCDPDAYAMILQRLDRLEGVPHHYDRVSVLANLDGEQVEAWVYTPNDPDEYENDFRIPDNDWDTFLATEPTTV